MLKDKTTNEEKATYVNHLREEAGKIRVKCNKIILKRRIQGWLSVLDQRKLGLLENEYEWVQQQYANANKDL